MSASPDQGVPLDLATPVYSDFPSQPQSDPGLPAKLPTQFTVSAGEDAAGVGPCIIEPSMGALFPNNWTPIYFSWSSADGDNLFELRLHVANQQNDLVVYTQLTSYTMPAPMWAALAADSADLDIEVTIRSATLTGTTLSTVPATGTKGTVRIAPVAAPGNIVYWTTSNGSALKGYTIGAPMVSTIITPALMADTTTCVGCHTSSPDGKYAFLSRGLSGSTTGAFEVDARTVDGHATEAVASDVSVNALANLARGDQTLPVLSLAHYSATDAIVITTLSGAATSNVSELVWTDLHATTGGTGIIARTGDPAHAALPAWSHDGKTIAYVSTTGTTDGRATGAPTDIYTVPYNNHAGGTATPLPGASDASVHEYYPVFSPDDKWIAYNESPGTANTYDEPTAELYVISSAGGTGTRLAANDPPACSGKVSPGMTNSWPRFSPAAMMANGKSYFWLVFSSRRYGDGTNPQLYVSAIVVDGSTLTTYPAIYITAQPPMEANHTPAWDVFQIPVQ